MTGDLGRTNLPIPHRPHVGLTTYDAKDPDTAYPPIEPLLLFALPFGLERLLTAVGQRKPYG